MASDETAGLRADARRNRDRIVAAAKRCFADFGPEVPVEEIARSAGVAPGTLYRRFPDRDALISAVALDNLQHALAETRAAAAEEPTAWAALVRVLRQSYELRLSIQLGMAHPRARAIVSDDPRTDELRRAMLDVVDSVVSAAQAEGSLRADVGAGDVAALFILLVRPTPMPMPGSDPGRLASERCLAVMLDGLRAASQGRPTPLPGEPLTSVDAAG
jgi:AcrR family transcriptional regulator